MYGWEGYKYDRRSILCWINYFICSCPSLFRNIREINNSLLVHMYPIYSLFLHFLLQWHLPYHHVVFDRWTLCRRSINYMPIIYLGTCSIIIKLPGHNYSINFRPNCLDLSKCLFQLHFQKLDLLARCLALSCFYSSCGTLDHARNPSFSSFN